MTVEVFRIRYSRAIGGQWDLYENREAFEAAVLEAMIEVAAAAHNRDPVVRRAERACAMWARSMFARSVFSRDDDLRPVERVYAVEQLVDGEWVELAPRLVPPRLEWDPPTP